MPLSTNNQALNLYAFPHPAFCSVEKHHLDAVVVRIHPVQDALLDVQAEAIGPEHSFRRKQDASV